MSQSRPALDQGIEHYQALIQGLPELRAEFEASLAQFFKAGFPSALSPIEALASSRRHLEWFLFERHSASLRNRPADGLLELWQDSFPDREPGLEASLLQSFSGLFEIVAVEPGVGARAADLSGLQFYDLSVEDGQFELGDLAVGRLHPIDEETYVPSTACASFRNKQLLTAVKKDVEQIRSARDRKVFRIAQEELEGMFFSSSRQATPVELAVTTGAVEAAQDWLTGEGIAPHAIETILLDLREHAPDPENIHPGRGDALGHWLDELAFTSELNLEQARTKLLAAWVEFHAPSNEAPASMTSKLATSKADDVGHAIAEFERDCASGKAISAALVDLEKRLALDMEETGDVGTVPDFPGVVGAMVEEFLWEEESQFGPESVAGFEILHAFSSYSRNLGVFEELGRKDVADFAARWIPENSAACEIAQIPLLLKALAKFCTWAFETQGALGLSDASELLGELQGTLERIARINTSLDGTGEGELFEVSTLDDESIQVSQFENGEERRLSASDVSRELRVGDMLRIREAAERLVVIRAYPAQLGSLLRELADA